MQNNASIITNLFEELYEQFSTMDNVKLDMDVRVDQGLEPAYQTINEIQNLVSYLNGNTKEYFSFTSILHMSRSPSFEYQTGHSAQETFGRMMDKVFAQIFEGMSEEEQKEFLDKIFSGEEQKEAINTPESNETALEVIENQPNDVLQNEGKADQKLYKRFERFFTLLDSESLNERTLSFKHAVKTLRKIQKTDEDFSFSKILKASDFENRLSFAIQNLDNGVENVADHENAETGLTVVKSSPTLKSLGNITVPVAKQKTPAQATENAPADVESGRESTNNLPKEIVKHGASLASGGRTLSDIFNAEANPGQTLRHAPPKNKGANRIGSLDRRSLDF